ncbi:hypothetical protein TrVGV298_006844 [Trichoderma virens]|nr:hypothetical protein TrVGV298_006844 [Trichoderma virens]
MLHFSHWTEALISPFYVLFHLIRVTQQFALAFYYVVNSAVQTPPASDVFTNNQTRLGDCLNLAQLALVWVLWLMVVVRNSIAHVVLTVYLAFLLISLVPVVVDAAWLSHDATYHEWAVALFHDIHTILVNPIVAVLILASFFPQRAEILQHPPGLASSLLSLVDLIMQAVVFALLALGWRWRLLPWDASVGVLATTWYQLVGFIPVDHAMFALVQAALSAVAALRRISTIFIVHLVAASVRARRFHPFGPHCSFLCTLTPDTAVVITCLNKKEDFLLGDDVVAKLIHEYMYALYARARHEMYEAIKMDSGLMYRG